MMRLQGIAVSPGVAIGKAVIVGQDTFSIPRQYVEADAIEQEIARFHQAVEIAARAIEQNRDLVTQELGQNRGQSSRRTWRFFGTRKSIPILKGSSARNSILPKRLAATF